MPEAQLDMLRFCMIIVELPLIMRKQDWQGVLDAIDQYGEAGKSLDYITEIYRYRATSALERERKKQRKKMTKYAIYGMLTIATVASAMLVFTKARERK